ncbi:MAG: exosome non-catalytic core subunit rrp46 [Piccolia ochrophora]|nr:MAG: exosome non-catalytic core subunit rrp46 [Piccolia ochrophora]
MTVNPVHASYPQLNRADGSAAFSSGDYAVLAAVNGPVEVPRRDELPDEASIDVVVRPVNGVAALLQASVLALMSASIPLCTTLTSAAIVVDPSGHYVVDPSPADIANAMSYHVFGFSTGGILVVVDSEGTFDFDGWKEALDLAHSTCCRSTSKDNGGTAATSTEEPASQELALREIIDAQIANDQEWKRQAAP